MGPDPKILSGVLVHRAARPLRVSVSCGSGWPVQDLVFRFNQLDSTDPFSKELFD